ncbi:hypothetical protein [Dysgonomonas sp. ZJ709]|uniref:hypothetical protein n=1 Tax=Dysgonomonas sp. ZJ709 TaxID=2709797 RepID=UPI0013EDB5CE|nr:hypothetical protein [Dysgonomonas sp. ZJ709]
MKQFLTLILILNITQLSFAQELITVKGRVLDNEGKPAFALYVYEKGNPMNYTKGDDKGYFSIQIKPKTNLIFDGHSSYIRQEVAVKRNKFLNVVMQEKGYSEDYDKTEGFYLPKNSMSRINIKNIDDSVKYSKAFILNRMLFDCKEKQIGQHILFPVGTVGTGGGFARLEVDHTKTKVVVVGQRIFLVNKKFYSQALSNLLQNPESVQSMSQSDTSDSIITYWHGERVVLKNTAPKIYMYQQRSFYKDKEGLFLLAYNYTDTLKYITDGVYANKDKIYIIQKQKTAIIPINLNDAYSVYNIDYNAIKKEEISNNIETDNKEYLRILRRNNYGVKDNIDRNNLQIVRNTSGKPTHYIYDGQNLFYKEELVASDIDLNKLDILHPECLTDGVTYYIAGTAIHKNDLFVEIDWIW